MSVIRPDGFIAPDPHILAMTATGCDGRCGADQLSGECHTLAFSS